MSRKFYIFLGVVTLFRLIYALFLPAAPQEAYYWNYGRHLAMSYFDHPPMAAYMIKLTTFLGISDFTVHLAAISISFIMSLVIFRLATLLFDERTAFWSGVAINLTFIYALGSLIITPDTPMLLFWCLAMLACFKIDREEGKFWWILLGLVMGAGFMSKYPIVFAGLGALLYFLLSSRRIKWMGTIWPYLAIAVAIVAASPVIIWNYQHNWASFIFQTGRRAGEITRFRPDYFFGYIGTVIGIYGIIPIPLLFAGIWNSLKRFAREQSSSHALIVCFSLPLLLFLFPLSAVSWVKMNWTAPAFVGIFISATAFYFYKSNSGRVVRIWGKVTITFLAISFILLHIIFLLPYIYLGRGDYHIGWEKLADKVESVRRNLPGPYFICGYEYKSASELAFHLPDHPETVSNNILGRTGLQYDYWCDPDTLVGYNAIFVYDKRNGVKNPSDITSRFDKVEYDSAVIVERGGKKVTEFYIFRCYDYKGP